jgi:hypothetical protein
MRSVRSKIYTRIRSFIAYITLLYIVLTSNTKSRLSSSKFQRLAYATTFAVNSRSQKLPVLSERNANSIQRRSKRAASPRPEARRHQLKAKLIWR